MAAVKGPVIRSSPAQLERQIHGPSYFSSTVGKKLIMAISGILLAVYMVLHLLGNLLIYFGPDTFNGYGHFLIANPLIIPVEIGLLAVFVLHIYEAAVNYITNKRARPVGYASPGQRLFGYGWAGKPSRKSLASTSMALSGPVILAFVIVHVSQFKYGTEYLTNSGVRDLYRLEIQNFSNGLIVGFYVLCLVVIGLHLWHGISSALNSLGADSPRYTPTLLRISRIVAVVLAGAFITIPLWVYFLLRG